jgi:hypothetical protein
LMVAKPRQTSAPARRRRSDGMSTEGASGGAAPGEKWLQFIS